MNNVIQLRRPNKFSEAPRSLVDPVYFVEVGSGAIAPDPMAYPAFGGDVPKAEDYLSRELAYDLGFGIGFDIELGGRIEKATPPIGMARDLLGRFARGVLDGAECVRNAASARRPSDYDPWADLDG